MSEETVIVAYDGSPAAQQAVLEAAKLFHAHRMLVVSVWDAGLAYTTPVLSQDGSSMTPLVDPNVARDVDTALHQRADSLARDGAELAAASGCTAQPIALPDDGDVANTLLELASHEHAAAIVVGSRGHSGLRARLEGSTSKSLVKQAACPVLVVHAPDGRG